MYLYSTCVNALSYSPLSNSGILIFACLQCSSSFNLWGVTVSSSTVHLHFLMAKKKFQILGGEGLAFFVPLENPAWTVSRSTTDRQEITTPRTIGWITAPGGTTPPREGRVLRNKTVSLSSSAKTSSRVNGQAKQLAAIAVSLNSSAGLGGSGRGRGRGV